MNIMRNTHLDRSARGQQAANRAANTERPAYRRLTTNVKKIRRQLRRAARR